MEWGAASPHIVMGKWQYSAMALPGLSRGNHSLIRSRFHLRPGTLTLTLKRGYFITLEYFCISLKSFSPPPPFSCPLTIKSIISLQLTLQIFPAADCLSLFHFQPCKTSTDCKALPGCHYISEAATVYSLKPRNICACPGYILIYKLMTSFFAAVRRIDVDLPSSWGLN